MVHTRYANNHLTNKELHFEVLAGMADVARKDDHLVSDDFRLGLYHVGLHSVTRRFVVSEWEEVFFEYSCIPLGLYTALCVFFKVMMELVII